MIRNRLAHLSTLLAIALASACDGPPEPARTSVLLVTLDTTRANALGCYGNPLDPTPALDALAAESLVYDRARTVAPLTVPAHASMLTGLYPPRHTVIANSVRQLPSAAETLAELARANGIQTAAFVSGPVLDPWMGLSQGFETYQAPPWDPAQASEAIRELAATESVGAAREWLAKRDRERPFFAWLHLFDPHAPYEPPAELKERMKSAYLGEVAFVDQALAALFAQIRADGTLDRTLVIVLADHGENLGQHGEPSHGWYCYDGTLLVPMFIRYPDGWRAGERTDEVVSVVDVFPTALAALGLPLPPDIDGVDLYRSSAPPGRGVYFECFNGFLCFGWSPIVGWVDATTKYIHSSEPELYDLASDRQERKNLAPQRPADVAQKLEAIRAVRARPALPLDGAQKLDSGLENALRSLGYVGVDAPLADLPDPLAPSDLPAPKSRRKELDLYYKALELGETGKLEAGVEKLREFLRAYPSSTIARANLGDYLTRLERYAEARDVIEELLKMGHTRASTWNRLGWCRERLGDLRGAAQAYEAALAIESTHPFAGPNLQRVKQALGEG